MSLFQETFSIVNNSACTMTLDGSKSTGLGDGQWPATIAPNTTAGLVQTGSARIEVTAVYRLDAETVRTSVAMHFFCAGVDPVVHVNMTMTFDPYPPGAGSSIAETNSTNSWTTNDTTLNISTTGNGKTAGRAVFTIGGG
jgi:hypothetical protein